MMHNKPSQVSVTPLCRSSQNEPITPSEIGSSVSTKKSDGTSLLKPNGPASTTTVSPIFSPMTSGDLSAASVQRNKMSSQRTRTPIESGLNSPHYMLEPAETPTHGPETTKAKDLTPPTAGSGPSPNSGSAATSVFSVGGSRTKPPSIPIDRRSPRNPSRRSSTSALSDAGSEFMVHLESSERQMIDKPRLSFTRKRMIHGAGGVYDSANMSFGAAGGQPPFVRKDGSFSSNDTSGANLSSHVKEDANNSGQC